MISELILGTRFVVANSLFQLVTLLLSGPLRCCAWGPGIAYVFFCMFLECDILRKTNLVG